MRMSRFLSYIYCGLHGLYAGRGLALHKEALEIAKESASVNPEKFLRMARDLLELEMEYGGKLDEVVNIVNPICSIAQQFNTDPEVLRTMERMNGLMERVDERRRADALKLEDEQRARVQNN